MESPLAFGQSNHLIMRRPFVKSARYLVEFPLNPDEILGCISDEAQNRFPVKPDQALGEITYSQVFGSRDFATCGLLLAENQPKEGRFACSVRTNESDPIRGADIKVAVSEYVLVTVKLREALNLNHGDIPTTLALQHLEGCEKR